MPEPSFDPQRFFDPYPEFLETSETGKEVGRLNARFEGLIHANRDLLDGSRVLDLASHDARFSFAALACGAAEVVGIEMKGHLVEAGVNHLTKHGFESDRFDFRVGDLYDWIPRLGTFDVVLCFGIFYHVVDHLRLLRLVAGTNPKAVIVDTHVSPLDGCVVQLRDPLSSGQPPPGTQLEGRPTRSAVEAMLQSFGWDVSFVDWKRSDLVRRPGMNDYKRGKRVSAVARCPEHTVPDATRRAAVQEVLERQETRETQWLTVNLIADRYRISPQALALWVRRAERAAWLGVDPASIEP